MFTKSIYSFSYFMIQKKHITSQYLWLSLRMPKLDTTERLRILNNILQESQGHTMHELADKIGVSSITTIKNFFGSKDGSSRISPVPSMNL